MLKNRKCRRSGFSLLELLVVILIIGVLAAVALPQYQKAVIKSRLGAIKNLTRSIADAEKVYYMTYNEYTPDVGNLSVDMPEEISSYVTTNIGRYYFPWGYCIIEASTAQNLVYCVLSRERNSTDTALANRVIAYWMDLQYDEKKPRRIACYAYDSDKNSMQDQICQIETGHKNADVSSSKLRQYLY